MYGPGWVTSVEGVQFAPTLGLSVQLVTSPTLRHLLQAAKIVCHLAGELQVHCALISAALALTSSLVAPGLMGLEV